MKVCQRGWEYAQISDETGTVEICSWATANYQPIGNLAKNSMYDIWHGERAELFRDSLRDGSYRYCEKQRCPWLANGTLEDHLKEYEDVTEYPIDLSLSYERACNYRCTCCADSENCGSARAKNAAEIQKIIEKELDSFQDKITTLSANGRGELFTSPSIIRRIQSWTPNASMKDIHVVLESNGSLFNEENWKQIANLGKYDLKVTITVMSFEESAYKFLSGTSMQISELIKNLHFIRRLRDNGEINCFEIGTVIQERNFREMPEFVKRCVDEFKVDIVRLRSYFPFGDKDPAAKWLYDIRNKHHPYYSEYEDIMKNPIFKDPHVMMWSGEELNEQHTNPFEKLKVNYELLKILSRDEILEKIENNLNKYGGRTVAIYGVGDVGELFIRKLIKSNQIRIEGIIDKQKSGSICGFEIYSLEKYSLDEETRIIVTLPHIFNQIRDDVLKRNKEMIVLNIIDVVS